MAAEASTQGRRSASTRRQSAPRSGVWVHFTRFTDDDGNDKARCNRCQQVLGASTRNGTSTLRAHVRLCWGDQATAAASSSRAAPPAQLLLREEPAAAHGLQGNQLQEPPPPPPLPLPPLTRPPPCAPSHPHGSSDREASALEGTSKHLAPRPCALTEEPGRLEEQEAHHGAALGEEEEEASRDLARMITLGGHDPSVVENEHFRSFVRRLNPGFKLPSREAIEEMCNDVFTESSENMARSWPYDGGRVSYAVGIAKYFEAGEVLHVTGHFVDDEWKLHRVVEDARVLLPPGISTHCNDEATFLGVPVVSRGGEIERVLHHFFPAFDNPPIMVAGDITGDIGCLELKRRIERELMRRPADMEEREVMCSTYVDQVLHSVARCLLPDSGAEKKELSIMLDYSAWQRQDRQRLLSHIGLDDPWEYNEHWYWCYCSLKIDGDYLTADNEILLYKIWGKIYRAMKRLSAPGTPTSALCLRELLRLRDVLRSQLPKDTEGMSDYLVVEDTAIVGLKKALETLDKALEDSYLVWSLPLVLDPRYKLRHIEESFKKVFDDSKAANYTTEVRRMIKELYTRYTDNPDGIEDGDEDSSEEMAIDDSNPFEQARDEQCHSQDDSRAKTELENYLEDSPALTTKGSDFDILNWWKVHGSVQYPRVAQMAKTVLAMPTCSKLTSDQTAHVRSIIRGYKESDW